MILQPNMYVRFDNVICKIDEIEDNYISFDTSFYDHWNEETMSMNYNRFVNDYSPEYSYNIIDLIKSKDIILGTDGKLYQCWKIYKDYVFTYSKNKTGQTITLVDYQIDRVLPYSAFESISYKRS